MNSADAGDDAVAPSHINAVMDAVKTKVAINVISGYLSQKL
jgi:hypothetical protein